MALPADNQILVMTTPFCRLTDSVYYRNSVFIVHCVMPFFYHFNFNRDSMNGDFYSFSGGNVVSVHLTLSENLK